MLQLFELHADPERVEAEIGGIQLDQRRAADERPDERFDLGDAGAVDRLLGYFFGHRQISAHSAAAAGCAPIQCSRSPSARALSACFLASVLAVPGRRMASASGGNKPKLTFIGWNERGPASIASTWPPVMWFSSAPCAVVGGGSAIGSPSRSAAAKRPVKSPIAADSTYPSQPLICPPNPTHSLALHPTVAP